jgi:hypothetical protein
MEACLKLDSRGILNWAFQMREKSRGKQWRQIRAVKAKTLFIAAFVVKANMKFAN